VELINHLLNNSVDPAIWNIEEDPHAALAKVIVLDQFSRSAHRGTANAFVGDEICAALVRRMVTSEERSTEKMHNWFFDKFTPMERFFLVVSLQHSEILSNQELSVEFSAKVGQGAANPELENYFNSALRGFTTEHYNVVKRFGRFPHRNELLERDSTQEEIDWLNSPECPGWAKTQQKKSNL
jgi:uncharacterized protein (DUF924 family)